MSFKLYHERDIDDTIPAILLALKHTFFKLQTLEKNLGYYKYQHGFKTIF